MPNVPPMGACVRTLHGTSDRRWTARLCRFCIVLSDFLIEFGTLGVYTRPNGLPIDSLASPLGRGRLGLRVGINMAGTKSNVSRGDEGPGASLLVRGRGVTNWGQLKEFGAGSCTFAPHGGACGAVKITLAGKRGGQGLRRRRAGGSHPPRRLQKRHSPADRCCQRSGR